MNRREGFKADCRSTMMGGPHQELARGKLQKPMDADLPQTKQSDQPANEVTPPPICGRRKRILIHWLSPTTPSHRKEKSW